MSVLKDTEYRLTSPTFVAADGETPTDCATTPTCTVTRENGTALTAATVTAAAGDGAYTAAITATHTSQLDRLTITWTGTADGFDQVYKQELEVTGGWYVTIPEVQAEPDLSSTTVATIRRERDRFERLAESHCGTAFVPRYERETLRGDGSDHLLLKWPHGISVLSVTIDDVAQTASDFTIDPVFGLIYVDGSTFSRASGERNVTVAYTHGHLYPPADLKEACLAFIRSKTTLKATGFPNAAVEGSDSTRSWTVGTPGKDKPTGIDSVDEVLNRLSERIPGVA